MRMIRHRRLAKYLARSLLLLATIACLELGVRFLLKDITTTAEWSYFTVRWYRTHSIRVNWYGFRQRDFTAEPPEGVFRICVIGDSFVYGQGIPESGRLTNILEARLNADGKRFEVLNFGKDGSETEEHVQILRDFVLPLRPDFVLLQWFVNDVHGYNNVLIPRPHRLMPCWELDRFLTDRSALWSLAQLLFSRLQIALGLTESYSSYTTRIFRDEDGRPAQRAKDALDEFIDLCQTNSVPVGVVMLPDLVADLDQHYVFDFLMDRVARQCERRQVQYVDLRRTYSKVRKENIPRLWVNPLDHHSSAWANQLAAEAVLSEFGDRWRQGCLQAASGEQSSAQPRDTAPSGISCQANSEANSGDSIHNY